MSDFVLDSTKVGDTVTTQGWCVYCQRNTTWSIAVVRPGVLHFRCEDCKKIERDVTLSDPGGQ